MELEINEELKNTQRNISRISLSLLVLFLLIRTAHLFITKSHNPYSPGQKITLTEVLNSSPKTTSKSQKINIKGLEIITSRYPEYEYGDKLKITGVIDNRSTTLNDKTKVVSSGITEEKRDKGNKKEEIPTPHFQSPDSFPSSHYSLPLSNQLSHSPLSLSNQHYFLLFPKIEIEGKSRGNLFFQKTYDLRKELIAVLQKILPEPEAGLAAGIVLGVKASLEPGFKIALQNSGLTHVVAASGTNLTLVSIIVLNLGAFLFGRRKAVLIGIPFIWFYALLAGFEAAIIRAAVMVSLSFIAAFFGRQSGGVRGLLIAGYLMVLLNPEIIFDLGFQLSFASMGGIIAAAELENPGLAVIKKIPIIGETVLQTIAAQIATLPIVLANFGAFNPFSFIINALVLWVVPPVMGLSALAGIIGIASDSLAKILIIPAYFLLHYFVWATTWFGTIDQMVLRLERINITTSLGIWGIIFGLYLYLAAKPGKTRETAN